MDYSPTKEKYCVQLDRANQISLVLKIIFYKVVFGNLDLDLDLKLIELKLRDFKSIDFRSYFKSKHFKGLKSLVNLSNPNP